MSTQYKFEVQVSEDGTTEIRLAPEGRSQEEPLRFDVQDLAVELLSYGHEEAQITKAISEVLLESEGEYKPWVEV